MRRKLTQYLLFLCLGFPHWVSGQVDFGVKGGLNISDIVITNYVDPDAESEFGLKFGPHAGFFLSGRLDERLGIAVELLYSSKGTRENANVNLHYVAVPLLLQYPLSERISAELGPELAYLVSATSRFGNAVNTYNNKLDLGIDAGFRYGSPSFILGLRYCVGLFSVVETGPAAPGQERVKYQNRVLQFSLGYKLRTWE